MSKKKTPHLGVHGDTYDAECYPQKLPAWLVGTTIILPLGRDNYMDALAKRVPGETGRTEEKLPK